MEVLVSIALTGLALSFYLTFASQTNFATTQSKNYLQAVSIMESTYQDILTSNLTFWPLNVMYTTKLNISGGTPESEEEEFFTFSTYMQEHPQVPGVKEVICAIEWNEDGRLRKIDYRVIK